MTRWICVATATVTIGLLAGLRTDGVQPPVAPPPRPAGLNIRPGYTVVPLKRGPITDWWYVDAEINGKKARLMLDTGAPMCILHSHASARFGFPPAGPAHPFKVNGGGQAEFRQAFRTKMSVGPISSDTVRFQIMSAPTLIPSFEIDGTTPCDGLLGAEFLHAHAAVVDYPAGLLHLRDPIAAEHQLQGKWVCVARETAGTTKPEHDPPTHLHISGSAVKFELGKQEFKYRLWLDPSCLPKRLDLLDADDFALPMIYRIENGTLTIAAALFQPRYRVGQRPTEFHTTAESAITILTFKKDGK